MAIQPTSANTSTISLSQKLRDLGRLKSKSEERVEKEFEIIHTPDRPSRLISPIEAPTEEECGDEIARWQRASLKQRSRMFTRGQYGRADRVGQPSLRHRQGWIEEERRQQERCGLQEFVLTWLNQQDDSAVSTESDDDADERARHRHATDLAHGREVGRGGHGQQPSLQHHQSLKPVTQGQTGQPEVQRQQQTQAAITGFQHSSGRANYTKSPDAPAPLFSGTPRSAPTSHPRSVSPGLATVVGDNSLARARYTGSRIDIYRRGTCPFCRKSFGNNPLPLFCPYPDCKRDLRKCLEYPNRREVEKAPPRLGKRAFLYAQQGVDARTNDRGIAGRPPVPSLTVEAPTPIDDHLPTKLHAPPPPPTPPLSPRRRKSPSPSNTIRTIWPSPLGFYDPAQPTQPPTPERQKYIDKPLPPTPTPTLPTRSERRPPPPPSPLRESISVRHQQLYSPRPQQQPRHINTQTRPTPPTPSTPSPPYSPTPVETPSPCSSVPSTRTNSPSFPHGPVPVMATLRFRSREEQQQSKTSSPPTPPSSSVSASASPTLGSASNSNSRTTNASSVGNSSSKETTKRPPTRPARPRSSSQVDDKEFLTWKTPRERERFEKERREKGDDAELFMDIIGEYGDGDRT